jgi:hypothetical protein
MGWVAKNGQERQNFVIEFSPILRHSPHNQPHNDNDVTELSWPEPFVNLRRRDRCVKGKNQQAAFDRQTKPKRRDAESRGEEPAI